MVDVKDVPKEMLPVLPPMPQMKDFQGVTEDVEWIGSQYQDAIIRWERVCRALIDAWKERSRR